MKRGAGIVFLIFFSQFPAYGQVRNSDTVIYNDEPTLSGDSSNAIRNPDTLLDHNGLMKFLAKNIRYPDEARENAYEGRPVIEFIVRKDGYVRDAKVKKTSGYESLDQEALRVVRLMEQKPYWKPGKQKGEPVDVIFTLPITFTLGGKR